MSANLYNVLFLCTGNSARSILAAALLNHVGKGRFKAYSAGSFPTGRVNPFALALLQENQLPVDGLRSKSWDEFAQPGSPHLHFIFTVCDDAAAETCPIWPGHPITAHWGIPDPAAVQGTEQEKRAAFFAAFTTLNRRISMFNSLPLHKLDAMALEEKLNEIGRTK